MTKISLDKKLKDRRREKRIANIKSDMERYIRKQEVEKAVGIKLTAEIVSIGK